MDVDNSDYDENVVGSEHYVHNATINENLQVMSLNYLNKIREWTTSVLVNGKWIKFKLDSGSEINTLPMNLYKKLNLNVRLERTNTLVSKHTEGTKSNQRVKYQLQLKTKIELPLQNLSL